MPQRFNKMIELLDQGQPVYNVLAKDVSYEGGRAMAQTWADYIKVDMEHAPFDIRALDQFMRGLVDGGPTRSGHRIPAVVAEVPAEGVSAAEIRANAWMFKQVLARGVTGINLCHAETPAAIKAFVEACRYPFHTIGSGPVLAEGRRGHGNAGEEDAAAIWGLSVEEYLQRADVWPLNPHGELMLGVKIENRRALRNAERSARVPGIGFAEWGSRDMAWSYGYAGYVDPPYPDDLETVRVRVFTACTQAGLFFHNAVSRDDVVSRLQQGVMIGNPRGDAEVAKIGRAYTKRTMPV
ncbi:MAG: aldolase/citrate lyase family protein [Chloroflexota bacterium]|nr:aldolase/citrate lyase family protein [Chloroflexota bacterium]